LENFKDSIEPVGKISETIFQAYSNKNTKTEIYKLKITIGKFKFEDYFRVIEKSDLFNILIGIDSLKRNRFDLNFADDTLYVINNDNESITLAPLYYDINLPISDYGQANEEEEEVNEEELNNNYREPVPLTIVKKEETFGKANDKDEKESIIKEFPKVIKSKSNNLFSSLDGVVKD